MGFKQCVEDLRNDGRGGAWVGAGAGAGSALGMRGARWPSTQPAGASG